MKKALSILLVAAAIFGFYGSAVTVNDLLACKDYWEEAGEKSTADMNKLEDGLNQLKDNEQAYLDGLDQIEAGEQQLAEGEAAYEAAPAQLAAGEKALAEGRKGIKKLRQALAGINKILSDEGYAAWAAGCDQIVPGRTMVQSALSAQADTLKLLAAFDTSGDYAGALNGVLTADTSDNKMTAFEEFNDDLKTMVDCLGDVGTKGSIAYNLDATATSAKNLGTAAAQVSSDEDFVSFLSNYGKSVQTLSGKLKEASEDAATLNSGISLALGALQYAKANVPVAEDNPAYMTYLKNYFNGATAAQGYAEYTFDALKGAIAGPEGGVVSMANTLGTYNAIANQMSGAASGNYTQDGGAIAVLAASTKEFREGCDDFVEGQATMAEGIRDIAGGVVGDATMRKALKKAMGASAVAAVKKFGSNKSPLLAENGATTDSFKAYMDPTVLNMLKKARTIVRDRLKGANKQLRDGIAQLNEGYANYAAAPDQLAEGRQALEDGKAQLAAYEDGEQQVRDGLASLFGTEADLDLVSIADRLNGDGDFDNGDNHLELDEGLNAVDVGREYQADDGVLITKEIMGRAVATGGLIGAAVLAVLAAILSFLKKNKAAGVFAILAAAAGAFGAFYGPAQGVYFSEIAGSTIGATTWVAAGVLGAVALVHAIVHFAAPKTVA